MASTVKNHELRQPPELRPVQAPARVTKVFIPLITPYLYGMERAVIELFDALRPQVEPYFLQSNRIFQQKFPIVDEMKRRGFSIRLLPDRTDWERLARPRSLKHFVQMTIAAIRCNVAILKGVRGKDVLYVPGISTAAYSLLAAMYCRLTGRRVIHHFHDLGTTNRLFPIWVRLATDFVHNTEFGFNSVVEKIPAIRGKRNFIVPCFIELDERLPEDPEVCRELKAQRNLFFVGQISRHKGVDLLVKAFKMVAAKHPDVMLHVIGDGKEEFRATLQNEINVSGLLGRVKFWGFREDATRLLRFAYVYVQPSPPSRFQESFGRSVVEAMAHGVPVVCFRSGALQEIVVAEETGALCDETFLCMGRAIDSFLLEPSLRNRCGNAARQRYADFYSTEIVRRHWAELLRIP
jgi:glycosyltransferase involved in cell wall biosynthesis